MKTQEIVILIVLLTGMASCKGDEINIDSGINFCNSKKGSEIIVKYNDIVGYDSTKYIFCIAESSWNRIKGQQIIGNRGLNASTQLKLEN